MIIFKYGLAGLAVIAIIIALLIRVPLGRSYNIDVEIKYQMIDLGQGDYIRGFAEMILGNKRLFFVGGGWVYVGDSTYNKAWGIVGGGSSDYGKTGRLYARVYPVAIGVWVRECDVIMVEGKPKFSK